MMQHIIDMVGKAEIPESWRRNYAYASDCYPGKEVRFLHMDYLTEVRKQVYLTDFHTQLIVDAIEHIQANDKLRFLAWLWHCVLFRKPNHPGERPSSWPSLIQSSDVTETLAAVFPAVVLLSGYDQLYKHNASRNIPQQIIWETLRGIDVCMNLYYEKTGNNGFGMRYLDWSLNYFHGSLYRIGRLEYQMSTFGRHVYVYCNKHDSSQIAFSAPNIRYRGDGHVDGTNQIFDNSLTAWTATLTETEDEVIGYTITAEGYAANSLVRILKRDWNLMLSPSDPVLKIHIPRGEKLSTVECEDSLAKAEIFFQTYFPEKSFHLFKCISWMLDPQLQMLLGGTSNLSHFQKLFHLFPVLSDDAGLFSFVFRCDPCTIDELPLKTTLHRKIKDYMSAGGHMHAGGGFRWFSTHI